MAAAAPASGSTNDLILQSLRKGPKSPMELAKSLGMQNNPQNMYAATSVLKAKGLIESKPVGGENDDGTHGAGISFR